VNIITSLLSEYLKHGMNEMALLNYTVATSILIWFMKIAIGNDLSDGLQLSIINALSAMSIS